MKQVVLTLVACLLAGIPAGYAQKPPRADEAFREIIESQSELLKISEQEKEELDIFALVDRYMLLKLRDTLDLTDQQALDLVDRIDVYKDRLSEQKWYKGYAREQLRKAIESGEPDTYIREKLESLLQQEQDIVKSVRNLITAAREDITVSQAARLYLFLDEFEAEIKRLIHRAVVLSNRGAVSEELTQGSHRKRQSEDSAESRSQQEIEEASEQAFDDIVEEEVRSMGADTDPVHNEEMRDMVRTLMMLQLAKVLELSPEETVLVLQRVSQYRDKLYQMKVQIAQERESLATLLDANAKDDMVATKLDDMLLQEEAIADLIRVLVTEAEKDIGLIKAAKLYLFVEDFEDRIRMMVFRAQQLAGQLQQ